MIVNKRAESGEPRAEARSSAFCFLLSALFLLAAGCASRVNSSANLLEPEFRIRQLGGQAYAARHVQGAISVNLQIEIINRSAESLQVDRIQVESMGAGAYSLPTASRPFGRAIPPEHIEVFEMWVPANAENTILGSNGPVTIRSVVFFTSAVGKFQKVYVRQVNDQMRRPGAQ